MIPCDNGDIKLNSLGKYGRGRDVMVVGCCDIPNFLIMSDVLLLTG